MPVKVLVTDPMRVCRSAVIGIPVSRSLRPYALMNVPFGLRTPTIAPGVAMSPAASRRPRRAR